MLTILLFVGVLFCIVFALCFIGGLIYAALQDMEQRCRPEPIPLKPVEPILRKR